MNLLKAIINVVRDPERTDAIFHVISNPVVTNQATFKIVYDHMTAHPETKELIESRHLGNWDLRDLIKLPEPTFGHQYAKHMIHNKLDPEFYPKLDSTATHSYIQMRSRQTHDIWHVLTGFSTSIADEAGLQAFSYAQMRSPASLLIVAMFIMHATLFRREILGDIMDAVSRGWLNGRKAKPLFSERFEDFWTRDMDDYRKALNLHVA